jgi:predicted glycosyltransferase
LRVPRERIHHVLYYADLLIADTGTMVTEAALLGTPALCYHPKAREIGNFVELEEKYQLIFTFGDHRALIEKAVELLTQRDLKKVWRGKQEKLIHEKIDITQFMTWFIENYPESLKTMKRDPAYQKVFI